MKKLAFWAAMRCANSLESYGVQARLSCTVMSAQAGAMQSNPVVAGQQRFQEMVSKMLLMGFQRPEVQKALLVAHREGLKGDDATLLRAIECLTQS